MTAAHPSAGQLARFRRGDLTAAEILHIDDHVAVCKECRAALRAPLLAEATDRWQQALGEQIEHATYEEIETTITGNGSAEARARVAEHLAVCARCRAEADDLRAYASRPARTVSAPRAGRKWIVVALAAAVAVAVITVLLLMPRAAEAPIRRTPVSISRPAAEVIPPDLQAIADQILSGNLASRETLRLLNPPLEGHRGEAESRHAVRLTAPVGVVMEDDRPLFTWSAPAGTEWSRVEVFDSSLRRLAASEPAARTEWRPETPLPRGATYLWQVRARREQAAIVAPAPPLPPARFRIVSAEAARELRAARESGSHLALGLLYAREGMFAQARAEFDALAAANPQSRLPRALAEKLN